LLFPRGNGSRGTQPSADALSNNRFAVQEGLWIRPEPPVGGGVDEAKRAAILEDRAGGAVLGITGEPSDITYAILYLASDATRFVTGQVLRPNGGVAMP
jgi:NAD(P)-dependent dehydrogenase (short-subunit alcohol dehydrogenase family)